MTRLQALDPKDATGRSKELFEGISNGKTIYPDEFHLDLIRAHSWLLYRPGIEEKKKALDFAIKAFNLSPSPVAIWDIHVMGTKFVELSSAVNKFCSDYFNEFTENEAKWLKQDGYRRKIEAVQIACLHLRERAQAQKNTKLVSFYYGKENEYIEELIRITQDKRW